MIGGRGIRRWSPVVRISCRAIHESPLRAPKGDPSLPTPTCELGWEGRVWCGRAGVGEVFYL